MTRTASTMLPLGTRAPSFKLIDVVTGTLFDLTSTNDAVATVIMFICNHCPYVKHVNAELTLLANDYIPKGVRFIAINSNDVSNYPDDSPDNMKITAQTERYPFPYLFDDTQGVAKAYKAACTPDFYVFDEHMLLAYRGQLDDSRPGNNIIVTGNSIRMALNCLLHGRTVDFDQKPSLGCNIKWRSA